MALQIKATKSRVRSHMSSVHIVHTLLSNKQKKHTNTLFYNIPFLVEKLKRPDRRQIADEHSDLIVSITEICYASK